MWFEKNTVLLQTDLENDHFIFVVAKLLKLHQQVRSRRIASQLELGSLLFNCGRELLVCGVALLQFCALRQG